MSSIFEYTDYRKYLKDFYEEHKGENPGFSYRFIARHVGFKSAGHFTQILNGTANISITLIERFAEFLKLRKREAEYFQAMVLFNQARSHRDKKRYFERMTTFKEAAVKVLDVEQYEFYDKWYYSAVREILDFFPFKDDYQALARQIAPPIAPEEARRAVELLEKLGLVHLDERGYYKKSDAVISTGYAARSVAVNNFALNALRLAGEAVDRFPRNERSLSWLTMSLSEEGYRSVIGELRAFRRRALDIAGRDDAANRVYQFNFQVFPMSRPYEGGGR